MKAMQKGFTLIELVVVIVILGILAATALPKFVDLSGSARAAVIKSVAGSMASANSMIYAKANAASVSGTTASPASVTIGSATVSVAYGFAANATELAKVMDLNPSTDFTVASTGISHAGAPTAASCVAGYTAATSTSAPPSYTITTSGC